MNPEQIRQQLRDRYARVQALRGQESLSADDIAEWDRIKGEIETLKADLTAAETREREAAEFEREAAALAAPRGSVARGAAATQRTNREIEQNSRQQDRRRAGGPTILRRQARESRSESLAADQDELLGIADTFLRSQEYEQLARRGFSGETGPVEVRSFFHQFTEGLVLEGNGETTDPDDERETRALVRVGALPTDWVAPFRIPGIFTPDLPEFSVRSAFLNGQTNSNVIQFYRELAFDNQADWVAEATATTGASGLKPESGLTWERGTSPIETLAHWIPVTDQTLEDEPQMRAIIEGRLIDGLREVEDDALINGTGTPPEIEGLLGVSGVQVLDATHFGTNPTKNSGSDVENFDRILRARRMIRTVGRARPSFILLAPEDMESLQSTTNLNNDYIVAGGPFGAPDRIPTIWRLPVIETEALTAGTAIVGDGRMAAVWDRMAADVKIGLINDQFVRNMQTILAEERLGFAVYRPPAFAVVTLV